ncbi:hypothetical protein C0585_00720 [Candidatus Woesearchaeota archaeon]|nr:MAG: hypothetical protein C0585_00720 [Candidatus Woesearchaeota archaeon]
MKNNNEWINISDMMAGLMMFFLFISIIYMMEVSNEKKNVKEIVVTYRKLQKELNEKLNLEFKNDLTNWDAEILENNTIRFKSPDVLFETGESEISDKFQNILNNFFPRYLKIITEKQFENEIDEVRVEGHTSSRWLSAETDDEKYINNISLSQIRAKKVLEYCYLLDLTNENKKWLTKVFRANGMAFAKLIFKDGFEDIEHSQRVEFRVITKAEEKIFKIIDTLK